MKTIKTFFFDFKFVVGLYLLITILISLLQLHGTKEFNGKNYTHYNNYVIFKNSFSHLVNYENPYQEWPNTQWDLFKYSPTFAMFMYPFSLMPDWLGLILWNLINMLALLYGIFQLKYINAKTKIIMLFLVLPELIISLQNSQSNGLMVGLIIIAFNLLESGKFKTATLLISLSVFIKIFGIVAFILCLLYNQRWKAVVSALVFMLILTFMPALLIGFSQLKLDYFYWYEMLKNDHNTSVGLSVLGFIKTWFNYEASKAIVTVAGMFLLLLPLVRWKQYDTIKFRMLLLASILIWLVIFNHKAESPTFIIAVAGAAIWYFCCLPSKLNFILLLLAFILSSISPTDLFPKIVRINYVNPYVLKVVPFILIWIKIEIDLLTMKINAGERFQNQ